MGDGGGVAGDFHGVGVGGWDGGIGCHGLLRVGHQLSPLRFQGLRVPRLPRFDLEL